MVHFLNPPTLLDFDTVPGRHTLELDQIVVGAVGGEQCVGVLEVLALGVALKRLLARLEEPIGQEDAPVRRSQRVVIARVRGVR